MITKIVEGTRLDACYRLRYKVFADKLRWIPENSDHLDTDGYDQHSVNIGAYDNDCLVGTCRITSYNLPWMLTDIFTWYDGPIEPDSVEFSRLAIGEGAAKYRRSVFAHLVHKAFECAQTLYAYAVTTAIRAKQFKSLGIVFDEIARHDSSTDSLVVIRIDNSKTDWDDILERSK
jgi:N-acyl-L-homoserine lactone synthetase